MNPYQPLEDRYVTLGPHRVRYWQAGDAGPAVVLVHALGASVEYWARVMPTLARHHRVFALDLLGFGLSDKPDLPYGEALLAGVVRDFADGMGLERFHLVGNSMGGAVSQRVARENPQRIASLALVCSGGLGTAISPRVRLLSVALVGEFLARPRPEMTKRLIRGGMVVREGAPRELLDASLAHARSPGARRAFLATLRNGIRLDGQRPAIVDAHRAAFPRMTWPTLVMTGDRDPIIPTDHDDAIRAIPLLTTHRFAGCGHYPQLEQPEAFCDVLLRFLEAAPTPAASGATGVGALTAQRTLSPA
ncbi:alpha/beta fold hydrolase [Aquabacterium humicola]|uniref:alpha/beta fold hydrolase n=1 Tax=Aquabacterium humicola TaxID=3237377 RepID=UPI0025426EAA|nr:alpha/beta fold hydrolase [Rubrivivax pictus]